MRDKITKKIRFFINNADEYLCSSCLSFCHGLMLPPLKLFLLAFELILKGCLIYVYKEEAEDYIDKKLRKYSHDLAKIYKELCGKYPDLYEKSEGIFLRNYGKVETSEGIFDNKVYGRAAYSGGVFLPTSFKEEVLERYLSLRKKITTIVKDEVGDLPMAGRCTEIIRKYNKLIQKDFISILNKSSKNV